jgi:hypothetical protein
MESAEDYPLQDQTKDYCCYCARPSGEMQTYEERLDKYSDWFVRTQGLDKAAATKQAKTVMADLPAWKNRY